MTTEVRTGVPAFVEVGMRYRASPFMMVLVVNVVVVFKVKPQVIVAISERTEVVAIVESLATRIVVVPDASEHEMSESVWL